MTCQNLFPLKHLLQLYCQAPKLLYLERFEAFLLILGWIGPQVSRSLKRPIELPIYLLTYECVELGRILGEHPSVIWQELLEINFAQTQYLRRRIK